MEPYVRSTLPRAMLRSLIAACVFVVIGQPVAAGTQAGIEAFEAGEYQKAFEALNPEAHAGDDLAQLKLAEIYLRGLGVEKNTRQANTWLKRSSTAGNARAQLSLGYSYSHGIGVAENKEKAASLYRQSAEQGNALAQRNLGLMYEEGEGVDYDAEEAARWFRLAAEQGDVVAQTHLGQFLWMGRGPIPRDRRAGLALLKQAARQDHAHAQYLYCANRTELHGQGADALVDAFMWCKLAADQGYPGGEQMWEAAEHWFLSAGQKQRAAELADEWRQRHR